MKMEKKKLVVIISLVLVFLLIIFSSTLVIKENFTGKAIQRDLSEQSRTLFEKLRDRFDFRRGDPIVLENPFKLQGDIEREVLVFEFDNSYYTEKVIDETLEKLNLALVEYLDEKYVSITNRHISETGDYSSDFNSYEELDYSLVVLEGVLSTEDYEELS